MSFFDVGSDLLSKSYCLALPSLFQTASGEVGETSVEPDLDSLSVSLYAYRINSLFAEQPDRVESFKGDDLCLDFSDQANTPYI